MSFKPGRSICGPQQRVGAAMNTTVLDKFGSQVRTGLRSVIAHSRHPMLIADDERRWVSSNAAARDLLGLTPDEIPWRTIDEFTSAKGCGRLEEQWDGFLASGAAEGWYELCIQGQGALRVEFSAIARVMPRRHLLVFIPLDEASTPTNVTALRTPAWAPVASAAGANSQLSKREREIMTLIAAGGQTADIAARLFLSPETVKSHAQHAMGKLGAHTRAHAVAIALVTRQITPSAASSQGHGHDTLRQAPSPEHTLRGW